jgi:hypothetical protein
MTPREALLHRIPYHGTSQATGRNPRQRFWLDFAVFGAAPVATDCQRLQPRGSIKAPSSVVVSDYNVRGVPGLVVQIKSRVAPASDVASPAYLPGTDARDRYG